MSDHYYTESPASAHDERRVAVTVLGQNLTFITDAGVFSKGGLDRGTEVMLNALGPLRGRVLDLGCGWGPVGVAIKRAWPEVEVTMTDVNRRAVELARRNLAFNGVQAQVVQGDGYEAVTGPFDAILLNPPIRAGKATIYGLFDRAREYLAPGGELYIVIRKQQGAPSALKHLREGFGTVEVIERSGGYWVVRAAIGNRQ